jgi:hypothetical protein
VLMYSFPHDWRRGNQIVRVIGSVPKRFSPIYVTLIFAIVNSATNVYITDAYFAPDHQMLHALERAAHRGVDVRLLWLWVLFQSCEQSTEERAASFRITFRPRNRNQLCA